MLIFDLFSTPWKARLSASRRRRTSEGSTYRVAGDADVAGCGCPQTEAFFAQLESR